MADVYIDDEKVTSINTNSSPRQMEQLLYTTPILPYGTHTVRLQRTTQALGLCEARYTDGSGIFEMKQKECSLLYGATTTVEIIRKAGSKGEATISYSTQSAGAEQGVNYVNLTDTVTFKEGETSKTITLTGLEGDRSTDGKDFYFTLMKRNDDGISYGSNTSTHVTLYTINADNILKQCENINTDDYTPKSAEAFKTALAELNACKNNPSATTEMIKEAAIKLIDAKNALELWNGYSAEEPYVFPSVINEQKTIEAELFNLDPSGAVNPNNYVRITDKGYATIIDWFEDGNKIKLPFYAESAGTYRVTASYRSGRTQESQNPNAFNWSGLHIESGTLDVYGEADASVDHMAEMDIKVTEAGTGELVFTADSKGGPNIDKFTIQFLEKYTPPTTIAVESVQLNTSTMKLTPDKTSDTLIAAVLPENATDKSVTFTSSAPDIATVDSNGVVTGKKDGTAVITVTTTDGAKTAQCAVTVDIDRINKLQELDQAVAESKKIIDAGQGDYTKTTWDDFVAAYHAAATRPADASLQNLETLLKNLNQAKAQLTPDTERLNKLQELDQAVAESKKIIDAGQGKYTKKSWDAFVAAYNQAAARPADASLQQLETLLTELNQAKAQLTIEEVKPTALKTPSAVKVKSKVNGVTISFGKVNGASSYRIYRKTGKGSAKKIATVKKTSYVDTKTPGGQKSTYTVVAVSGSSKYTNSAASKGVSITLPKAVTGVKAKAVKKGVNISFKKVKGAKDYTIYRASKKNGTYKKVKTLSAKKTSYLDKKAKKGKNYYKVIVRKGKVYGPASKIVSVNVKNKK